MPQTIRSKPYDETDEQPRKTIKKSTRTAQLIQKRVDETLNDMYTSDKHKHKSPAFARQQKQQKSSYIIPILLIIAFFAALAWTGWFIIGNHRSFNDTNIRLSIDAPHEITSGDTIDLIVHYGNDDDQTLNNVEIRVKPPTGFILLSSEPKGNGANEYHYKLGKLNKRDSGKIILHGTFIGAKDGNHEFTAFLSYRPENFNADFEKVNSTQLTIKDIPLALVISAPESVPSGILMPITMTLTNTSKNPLGPIQLRAILPDTFVLSYSSTTLKKPLEPTKFPIALLQPNEEWKGTLEGTFKSSASGEQTLTFENVIINDSHEYLQNTITHYVNVTAAQLEPSLTIDNFTKKGSVAPGGSVNIQVGVKNNSTNPVSNVVLSLIVENPALQGKSIINWEKLKKEKKLKLSTESISDTRARTTIIWDSTNTNELINLPASSHNIQGITIPILTPQEFGSALPGNTILATVTAKSDGGSSTNTPPFEISLRSDTTVMISSTPAGDPIVGVGPDGLTEVSVRPHDVIFTISNSLHEILDLEFVAELPASVAFEKALDVQAGDIQYNKSKRSIRFVLNKLPLSVPSLSIKVRLDTITPIGDTESDLLLSETTFTAVDSVSQDPFIIKSGSLKRK